MKERDPIIDALVEELAKAEGISRSDLVNRLGSQPRFRASAARLADGVESPGELLERQLSAALSSSYPGPACLRPHEMEDLVDGRLPEVRRAHVQQCDDCGTLTALLVPPPRGPEALVAAAAAKPVPDPLLDPVKRVGYALTDRIAALEGSDDRRVQLREALASVSSVLPGSEELFSLLVNADEFGWPQWAVECLPSLCIPHLASDGSKRLLVWHYIAECLEAEDLSDVRLLCDGVVLDAAVSDHGWRVVDVVTPVFEAARQKSHET
jgi:hypothetical protein